MRDTGKRKGRAASIIAGTVVGSLLALGIADTVSAARVERALSAAAREHDHLPADPDTFVGGSPFAQVLLSSEVPRLSFEALDIDVEGVGIANSRTDIHEIDIAPRDAYAARFEGATAKQIEHTLSLDGVAFGQLLGMTDLDISNPYDISPAGGTASEAQLTGTIPGADEKTTVVVTLRLDGPTFRMSPSKLIDVPADLTEAVTKAYTLELDTRDIPIGSQADMVEVAGGSIRFTAHDRNVTLTPDLLSPVAPTAR